MASRIIAADAYDAISDSVQKAMKRRSKKSKNAGINLTRNRKIFLELYLHKALPKR